MITRDNKGYVLITALLMLLVLTVIGLAAISTSTLENLLSGNIRLKERNIAFADGCSEISLKIIEHLMLHPDDSTSYSNLIKDFDLRSEQPFATDDGSSTSRDVECSDGEDPAFVDIDKMYTKPIGGTSNEFAGGYEGLGKGGGSGYATYYRVNASRPGEMNSESRVGAIYRYIP